MFSGSALLEEDGWADWAWVGWVGYWGWGASGRAAGRAEEDSAARRAVFCWAEAIVLTVSRKVAAR